MLDCTLVKTSNPVGQHALKSRGKCWYNWVDKYTWWKPPRILPFLTALQVTSTAGKGHEQAPVPLCTRVLSQKNPSLLEQKSYYDAHIPLLIHIPYSTHSHHLTTHLWSPTTIPPLGYAVKWNWSQLLVTLSHYCQSVGVDKELCETFIFCWFPHGYHSTNAKPMSARRLATVGGPCWAERPSAFPAGVVWTKWLSHFS